MEYYIKWDMFLVLVLQRLANVVICNQFIRISVDFRELFSITLILRGIRK